MANLLEDDIKVSCEELGLWNRRFRDMTMYRGSVSPFDYLIYNGKYLVAIEAKIINNKAKSKSFPFKRVRKEQREGLLELDRFHNSRCYILVNFRWINHKKGECFAITIDDFLKLEETLGRKSVPLDYFRDNAIQLDRYGKGWDLRQLM